MEKPNIGDFVKCVRHTEASVVYITSDKYGQSCLSTNESSKKEIDFEGTVIALNGDIMTLDCEGSPYSVHINKIVEICKPAIPE